MQLNNFHTISDTELVAKNKLFNNLQALRGDIYLMKNKGFKVDTDVLDVAAALAREIKELSDLEE